MADYPREIYLDEDTEERLKSYIDSELANHYAERGPHIDDLLRWQKDYWAKPTTEQATFPFTGAATLVIPLDAIAIETIHARNLTKLFALPQFVSAKAISSAWDEATNPVELFLNKELLYNIGIRKPMGDCFLEAVKFGTMEGKSGYEKIVKRAIRQIGEIEQEFDVVVKDGATVEAVPDSRFLMPHAATDPQTAPWCGEEHEATPYEIMLLERGGLFRPNTIVDKNPKSTDPGERSMLYNWVLNGTFGTLGQEGGRKFDENQRRLENTQPSFPKTLDWVELWLGFDVDQSGDDKEIVVHYHRGARKFMSVRYNWHADLRRPYRTGVYFPIEHRWRGLGVCKQNEQFQREITTQHRQRLDNATLANMRMIKVSKMSGYGPKEPVFPGKMWFLDSMDQVDTLQMGEVYPSSYNNEQSTLIYSQQRTGINEATLGMPQAGTPGTATADLARIEEGNKKSDFIYANFKEFASSLILDVASNIQQFGPRNLTYYSLAENGTLVEQFFSMPAQLIRDGILLEIVASGQQQNKVLDRQNWTQIAGLLNQYFVGLIQLAQMAGDQQLMQLILYKGLGAATEAMKQILESYDNVRNIDRMIVRELEAKIRDGLTATRNQQGGAGLVAGAGQAAPMDILNQAFSAIGGNGNGGANRLLGRT